MQLPVESLPAFSAVGFHSLDPRYPRVVLGTSLAFLLPLLLAAGIVIYTVLASNPELPRAPGALIFAALALGAGLLAWLGHRTASVIRYAIREHDVIVQSGIFWRKETVQPIRRIQHVEQHQGPIDRRFGLYELKLFSAGTGHFTFRIPGLDAASAARIKHYLLSARHSLAEMSGTADAAGQELPHGHD